MKRLLALLALFQTLPLVAAEPKTSELPLVSTLNLTNHIVTLKGTSPGDTVIIKLSDFLLALEAQQQVLRLDAPSHNPADTGTYWWGSPTSGSLSAQSFTNASVRLHQSFTIRNVWVKCNVFGALGTSEDVTLSLDYDNGAASVALGTIKTTAQTQEIYVTGLSQAVVAGHYIAFKTVNPTFSTNPTVVQYYVRITP